MENTILFYSAEEFSECEDFFYLFFFVKKRLLALKFLVPVDNLLLLLLHNHETPRFSDNAACWSQGDRCRIILLMTVLLIPARQRCGILECIFSPQDKPTTILNDGLPHRFLRIRKLLNTSMVSY